MRIFETRHGQVAPKGYYGDDPSLPVGDVALTPLGKEQARLVGERLKELGFQGVIFSSPYDRTLKTASIIAQILNLTVTPVAWLHEIQLTPDDGFCGATAEQIRNNYPCVQKEFDLPACWWGDCKEDLFAVIERVRVGLEQTLPTVSEDVDVLLVGHAATSVALRHLYNGTNNMRAFAWNCHLSLLYAPEEECYVNDCAYMPQEMWTGNALRYTEHKCTVDEGVLAAQELFRENPGEKVLHLGDHDSSDYGYCKMLIEGIKPDVIIHTGDLADEIKAGRIEQVRPYWRAAVKELVKMMEDSGARVIIVPGNNDVEEMLREMCTSAEVVARNTVLNFSGKRVLLCHELNRMDESAEADIFLYGHGLTGETRTADDNIRETKQFYNAVWGASVHEFGADKHLIIPRVHI